MSANVPFGPQVDPGNDLYRGITTKLWWVADEGRPSSAAFNHPDFSADIVQLAKSPAFTLAHLPPNSGVVLFHCQQSIDLGYDPRQELDPNHTENHAHANVYYVGSGSSRKRAARRLAEICQVAHVPTF